MARLKRRKRLRRAVAEREALRLLNLVPVENAFRFYTAIGEPTGEAASSAEEFLEKLQTLDLRSIEFHTRRGDFENWFRFLGDGKLAAEVADIARKPLSAEELRRKLYAAVSERLNYLIRVERLLEGHVRKASVEATS
ncbi:MAG: DUF5752 family protein [Candidatus Bathyarchaeia archaeon]